jgi:hypothetical protein
MEVPDTVWFTGHSRTVVLSQELASCLPSGTYGFEVAPRWLELCSPVLDQVGVDLIYCIHDTFRQFIQVLRLRVFKNRVLRRIFGLKRDQATQGSGEDYITRNLMTCTHHQILFG